MFGSKKESRFLLIYATDVHGSDRTFRKFVNAALMYKAKYAVLGGDLTGKLLIPMIHTDGDIYSVDVFGENRIVKEDQLPEIEKTINDSGSYTFKVSPKEKEAMTSEDIHRVFTQKMCEKLKEWVLFARQKLEPSNIPLFVTGGNDDEFEIDTLLKSMDWVNYVEGKVVHLDEDHEMLSSGFANITPWQCPRDVTEEELESRIEQMAKQVSNPSTSIFNLHVPPIGSSLAVCPKLDTSVFPPKAVPGETTSGGSTAVKRIIEKYQPMLGIHGHIHESAAIDKIGKTICVNPGSEYSEGILKAALITIDGTKVSCQLITG